MVRNFRVVAPGVALSGAPASVAEVDWLQQQGVRTVVSLHPVPAEVSARLSELGIRRIDLEMEDWVKGPPSGFLGALDEARARATREPLVLIHCSGGGGRAGTAYAAYCIRGGTPVEEAISGTPGVVREEQIAFLRGFAAGLSAR